MLFVKLKANHIRKRDLYRDFADNLLKNILNQRVAGGGSEGLTSE